MSEELEHSLQQAIETYLNERLRTIDEQLSRLQTDVSEALAQLRDNSSPQTLNGTTLSAVIFAHLQTARGQKLSGATSAAPVPREAKDRRHPSPVPRKKNGVDTIAKELAGEDAHRWQGWVSHPMTFLDPQPSNCCHRYHPDFRFARGSSCLRRGSPLEMNRERGC